MDSLAAAALAQELSHDLGGARVQNVVAVDRLSFTMELYAGRRHYLSLSANQAQEGVLVGEERIRRGVGGTPPLAQAVRAHLIGARLSAVTCPPHERILHLVFEAAAQRTIVAEMTGRMANVLLLDENSRILALARPVTAEMTRVRVLLPGRPYVAPPAPDKATADSLSESVLAECLADAAQNGRPAWRALVAAAGGVSPLAAREVCHRSGIGARTAADPEDAATLLAAFRHLFLPGATPDLVSDERTLDEADVRASVAYDQERALAWAPYALEHLAAEGARLEPHSRTYQALAAYETSRRGDDPYATARAGVTTLLETARARLDRRRKALARQVEGIDPQHVQGLRDKGDLILAYQWQVQRGMTKLEVPDATGAVIAIALDPAKSPVENAQAYYDRYQRRGRAAKRVPRKLAGAEAALATLDQWATDLRLAEDRSEIDAVHDALADSGWLPRPPRRRGGSRSQAPRKPLEVISSDGFTILVGRNSRQNERLTFELAARGDAWLHVRDLPGAHVVVKAAGRDVPEASLREAAALAAWFSAARDAKGVAVAVTDVRHVRRLKGGGPGMVRFEQESTLVVNPLPPEEIDDPGAG
jgi:predicted ribosome quality control (RQC) complex YloA/Tae2 family protein